MARTCSREVERTETMVDEIRLVECRYECGLVEIGVYRPQILIGAGPVLCAVVSRPEPGSNWFATTTVCQKAFRNKVKKLAVDYAVSYAKAAMRADPIFTRGGRHDALDSLPR